MAGKVRVTHAKVDEVAGDTYLRHRLETVFRQPAGNRDFEVAVRLTVAEPPRIKPRGMGEFQIAPQGLRTVSGGVADLNVVRSQTG